jgi:hypothetical protein
VRRRLLLLAAAAVSAAAAAGSAAALATTDPQQSQEWYLSAVGADQKTPPGPGVPLTVLDSGVDATQPDFAGRPDTRYLDAQTVADDPGVSDSEEFHGTEVASVAAAPANGIGIVGVYPQAQLDVWDVTPAPGQIDPASTRAGLAAAPCPGVINMSFGSTVRDPALARAVAAAQRRGCLIVASAGNLAEEGNATVYPAAFPHVLAVGASDQGGAPAPFSSTGAWVDLLAPGVGIEVDTTLQHDPSGNVSDGGTSFSAGIVAAAAAWVWTKRPTLSAGQVAALLKKTAFAGVLDIPAALAAPKPPGDPLEPNDSAGEAAAEKPLTTRGHPTRRLSGTLDAVKDPRDFYRLYLPAHERVRLSVTGRVVARLVDVRRRVGYARVTLRPGATAARYSLRVRVVRAGR